MYVVRHLFISFNGRCLSQLGSSISVAMEILKKAIVKSGANKWINNKVEQVDILKTISVLMPLKITVLHF